MCSQTRHAAELEQHTDRLRALQESLDVKDTVLGAAISQQSQLAAHVAAAEAQVLAKQQVLDEVQGQLVQLQEHFDQVVAVSDVWQCMRQRQSLHTQVEALGSAGLQEQHAQQLGELQQRLDAAHRQYQDAVRCVVCTLEFCCLC